MDKKRYEYWEGFFRVREDPWQYDNSYETTKYEQTLALLPAGPIGSALELACAEGHFTARLAPRVDRLTAADISPTAVERARARCSGASNVEFRVIDLVSDELSGDLDLVVCSEVLYYVALDQLALLPAKFAAALKPGGHVLLAHSRTIADERDHTGFDWGDCYGARTIAGAFEACSSFALKKELRTELYRIQLFQRTEPGQDPLPPPEIVEAEPAAPLPVHVEESVIWGGAVVTRAEARERLRATELPILMYHSVAESGPPELERFRILPRVLREHLCFLRRHGYHSVSLGEWARCIASGESLPGRPVVITFDDGYRDFIAHAAPLLEAAAFRATVFVVAGKVGATADWDKHSWPPLPLMDWDELRDLQRRGFEIGSHATAHVDLRTLPEEEILRDGEQARTMLREQLGCEADIMALPWGWTDARVRIALARAGYRAVVTTEDGRSSLSDDPLHLPRIEITGNDDVDGFARVLHEGRMPAEGSFSGWRLAPDAQVELALLRERLRVADEAVLSERGRAEAAEKRADTAEREMRVGRQRADSAEANAALQLILTEAARRDAGDEAGRAAAVEEELERTAEELQCARGHLRVIESSSTWRATAPLRSWLAAHPRITRVARQSAKLARRLATLPLSGQAEERLRPGNAPHAAPPFDPGAAEAPRDNPHDPPGRLQEGVPEVVTARPAVFSTVGASMLADIPVIVFSFNNLTYLRKMLAQLRACDLRNLVVIDNASSVPEMQDYLYEIATTTKVVRLEGNFGPHHIFHSDAAYRWLPDVFCLTDPDLAFNPELPGNFLEELAELTEEFKVGKAGFALDIKDRCAMRDDLFEIDGKSYRIWDWEAKFWKDEVGATSGGDPVYRADIDTTFALYNKRYFDRDTFFDALRVGGSFTCRHLPWYREHGMPEAEAETYRRTQEFSYYMRPFEEAPE